MLGHVCKLGAGQPVAIGQAFARLFAAPDVQTPGAYFCSMLKLALEGRLSERCSAPPSSSPPSPQHTGAWPPRPQVPRVDEVLRDLRCQLVGLRERIALTRDERKRRPPEEPLARVTAQLAERASAAS